MTPIPQATLDAGYACPVHVEGWNPATRFFHVNTVDGEHTIRTGKQPIKTYQTRNRLLYTRRNQPS